VLEHQPNSSQMSSNVDTIKERLSIVDVLSSYIKLEPSGVNFKARCPFHNEKTPSFFISPDRNNYYCFGCGAKGDIFSFVEQFEGVDFRGALKMLAEKAGVTLDYEPRENGNEKEVLYSLMDKSMKLYEGELEKNSKAKEYLLNRGLTENTIKDWHIGYSPDDWHFTEMSLKKEFNILDIEKAGLIKKGDKGYYDRFRGRIMFPLFDTTGRIVAFSGRAFAQPDDTAKYLNSPETPIFSKSAVLYGLSKAKGGIREKDYSILVEGQVDLLMSHQAGFSNTVATSGTALTEQHLNILKRFSNRIMVAYDADGAGWRASKRAWEMGLSLGMEIKIAEIPEGFDPADLILKDKNLWTEALKNSQHIVDLSIEKVKTDIKDPRLLSKRIREEVLPYVANIESNMEQSHYVQKISELGFSTDSVMQDLQKIKRSQEPVLGKESTLDSQKIFKKDSLERKILGIIYWQDKIELPQIDRDFARGEMKRIVGSDIFEKIEIEFKDVIGDMIFEAESYYPKNELLKKDIIELLKQLEIENLKKVFSMKMKEIAEAEKSGNIEGAQMLLIECQGVSKKINDLKNPSS
jgi:DNA primase